VDMGIRNHINAGAAEVLVGGLGAECEEDRGPSAMAS
jgi:hypothetical protein